MLPRVGQIIWITVLMAIYVRVTFVISRREELLEELHPTRETNERSAWYRARERRVVISDTEGTLVLEVDSNCDRKTTETSRRLSSSPPKRLGPRNSIRKR